MHFPGSPSGSHIPFNLKGRLIERDDNNQVPTYVYFNTTHKVVGGTHFVIRKFPAQVNLRGRVIYDPSECYLRAIYWCAENRVVAARFSMTENATIEDITEHVVKITATPAFVHVHFEHHGFNDLNRDNWQVPFKLAITYRDNTNPDCSFKYANEMRSNAPVEVVSSQEGGPPS